jgi:hypothetical protein
MKHPPAARVRLVTTILSGRCTVLCSEAITCPLCHLPVPPNTKHECEVDGPIRVVRNRSEDPCSR